MTRSGTVPGGRDPDPTAVPREPQQRLPRAVALLIRQTSAMDDWNATRHRREAFLRAAPSSRDGQLEANRRLAVLRRAHEAMLGHADLLMDGELGPMALSAPRRAVIAHRHSWLVERLSEALQARGVLVVTRLENGADALGTVVAEQPDVLVVGDRLEMMTGEELLREASLFASEAFLFGQAVDPESTAAMRDAGARAVFDPSCPPVDMAEHVVKALWPGPPSA